MNTTELMRNPDALLAAWQALTRRHHHLHQPQAAAMLGLPEASLVAALNGASATRLAGDPRDILDSIASMGKLMMAVSHHAGVLIGIAKPVRFERTNKSCVLTDEHNRLEIDADAIAHLYVLINEKGLHGRERHLQAFDQNGRAMFKLLVLYKRHAADLQALAERFRSADQARCLDLPLPEASSPPASSGDWGAMCDDLLQWSRSPASLLTRIDSPHVSLECLTTRPKVYGMDAGYLHFSHATMKLHARLGLLGRIDRDDSTWHSHGPDSALSFGRLAEAGS